MQGVLTWQEQFNNAFYAVRDARIELNSQLARNRQDCQEELACFSNAVTNLEAIANTIKHELTTEQETNRQLYAQVLSMKVRIARLESDLYHSSMHTSLNQERVRNEGEDATAADKYFDKYMDTNPYTANSSAVQSSTAESSTARRPQSSTAQRQPQRTTAAWTSRSGDTIRPVEEC